MVFVTVQKLPILIDGVSLGVWLGKRVNYVNILTNGQSTAEEFAFAAPGGLNVRLD